MTDQEKLQKLFDAALRAPEPPAANAPKPFLAAPAAAAVFQAVPAVSAAVAVAPTDSAAAPLQNAGLDETTSAELAALLEEQRKRISRKRRRDALVAVVTLFSLTGGSYAWFIQSPQRIQAYHETMKDFRSLGDIGSIVSKYREALAKVSVRSQQIDDSTKSMGVNPNQKGEKDPYFDAEMKKMMGGEGKTIGERNQKIQQKFGDMGKDMEKDLPK